MRGFSHNQSALTDWIFCRSSVLDSDQADLFKGLSATLALHYPVN